MNSLYDADILLWSEQQSDLLRRLAAGERVNDSVDWANLIEEVGDLGRSQLQAVETLLEVGLRHLLLAHGAPQAPAVGHWLAEALAALRQARRRYTPGIAQRIDLAEIWQDAREIARRKLTADAMQVAVLPEACPFTLSDLMQPGAEPEALLARLAG